MFPKLPHFTYSVFVGLPLYSIFMSLNSFFSQYKGAHVPRESSMCISR